MLVFNLVVGRRKAHGLTEIKRRLSEKPRRRSVSSLEKFQSEHGFDFSREAFEVLSRVRPRKLGRCLQSVEALMADGFNLSRYKRDQHSGKEHVAVLGIEDIKTIQDHESKFMFALSDNSDSTNVTNGLKRMTVIGEDDSLVSLTRVTDDNGLWIIVTSDGRTLALRNRKNKILVFEGTEKRANKLAELDSVAVNGQVNVYFTDSFVKKSESKPAKAEKPRDSPIESDLLTFDIDDDGWDGLSDFRPDSSLVFQDLERCYDAKVIDSVERLSAVREVALRAGGLSSNVISSLLPTCQRAGLIADARSIRSVGAVLVDLISQTGENNLHSLSYELDACREAGLLKDISSLRKVGGTLNQLRGEMGEESGFVLGGLTTLMYAGKIQSVGAIRSASETLKQAHPELSETRGFESWLPQFLRYGLIKDVGGIVPAAQAYKKVYDSSPQKNEIRIQEFMGGNLESLMEAGVIKTVPEMAPAETALRQILYPWSEYSNFLLRQIYDLAKHGIVRNVADLVPASEKIRRLTRKFGLDARYYFDIGLPTLLEKGFVSKLDDIVPAAQALIPLAKAIGDNFYYMPERKLPTLISEGIVSNLGNLLELSSLLDVSERNSSSALDRGIELLASKNSVVRELGLGLLTRSISVLRKITDPGEREKQLGSLRERLDPLILSGNLEALDITEELTEGLYEIPGTRMCYAVIDPTITDPKMARVEAALGCGAIKEAKLEEIDQKLRGMIESSIPKGAKLYEVPMRVARKKYPFEKHGRSIHTKTYTLGEGESKPGTPSSRAWVYKGTGGYQLTNQLSDGGYIAFLDNPKRKVAAHQFYGGAVSEHLSDLCERADNLRALHSSLIQSGKDPAIDLARKYGVTEDMFIEPVAAFNVLAIPVKYEGEGEQRVELMERKLAMRLGGIRPELIERHRLLLYETDLPERLCDMHPKNQGQALWGRVMKVINGRKAEKLHDIKSSDFKIALHIAAVYATCTHIVHHHMGGACQTKYGSIFQPSGHNVDIGIKDNDTAWSKDEVAELVEQGSLKVVEGDSSQNGYGKTISTYQRQDNTSAKERLSEMLKKLNLTKEQWKQAIGLYDKVYQLGADYKTAT